LSITKENGERNGRIKQIRRKDRKREDIMDHDLPNNSSSPSKLKIYKYIEIIFLT
jgi:hypothetical protein